MDRECPERKLDFHAPLLSTRRPGRIIVPREKWDTDSLTGFNDRVPFSWEQSPGKPKEILVRSRRRDENTNSLAFILPLKPPPIRLHPHPRLSEVSFSKEGEDDDDDNDDEYNDEDGGCDGDVDDNDEDGDFFSGGLDLFSLAESSNDGMATKKSSRRSKKGGGGGRRRAPPTPSYIMERFLPAAVALAVSSSSYPGMETPGIQGYESDAPAGEGCTPRSSRIVGGRRVLPSVSLPLAFKSCGFELLLPWRAKPKKNGVKGPLRFGCSDWKPQVSPRPK